jgi:hypothetical protein
LGFITLTWNQWLNFSRIGVFSLVRNIHKLQNFS